MTEDIMINYKGNYIHIPDLPNDRSYLITPEGSVLPSFPIVRKDEIKDRITIGLETCPRVWQDKKVFVKDAEFVFNPYGVKK